MMMAMITVMMSCRQRRVR